ncbi:MAG TPA: hypothetical protein VK464_21980 [Symbiobacteriaceae bacterium]|nr:hypothetical protein [Symbiobacteriaceae bacterium]
MALLLASALWTFHGMILWWHWGAFRPRIALLHGVGMALVAGLLVWLSLPGWLLATAGALVGGVGGWGHRLAPGLWVGVGLLAVLPFALNAGQALPGAAIFALAAQAVAALASLTRSAL